MPQHILYPADIFASGKHHCCESVSHLDWGTVFESSLFESRHPNLLSKMVRRHPPAFLGQKDVLVIAGQFFLLGQSV